MKPLLLALLWVLFPLLSLAQSFQIDTIQWTGPTHNRINLVILGDGYTSGTLAKFVRDAEDFTGYFFATTPYREYVNYFNVIAISVPSNQSGASHPGTASDVVEPVHQVSNVDNYYGSTFDYHKIHRLLVATNTSAIVSVLAQNFPMYDQVIMLVNTPYYGGSGGIIPTASLAIGSSEIALHELGHSFVGLKDEYYAGDQFASEGINMTTESNPNLCRWKNWLGSGDIGIYQHCCGQNSSSWYRPHENCKMRFLFKPFCSVCIEATVERMHDLVSPLDAYFPQNAEIPNLQQPLTFELILVESIPNSLKIEWAMNGRRLNICSSSAVISPSDLISGNNQLQATIQDTTHFLEVDEHHIIHSTSIIWNVNRQGEIVNTDSLDVRLFPNPVRDILNVSASNRLNENYEVAVVDATGRKLFGRKIHCDNRYSEIKMSGLSSGVYFVEIVFESGSKVTRRIFKE